MASVDWQSPKKLDLSQIKQHLRVQARNPGCMHSPCEIQIGVVDSVEKNQYIKLTKDDSIDGRYHWFPVDWVETVDEQAVYINKSADKAMAELMDRLPD
jgi:hypothetical protein